jgi:hypothetical protein
MLFILSKDLNILFNGNSLINIFNNKEFDVSIDFNNNSMILMIGLFEFKEHSFFI